MTLDLVIEGGLVADGTGGPLRPADVGVVDDRIVAMGESLGPAKERIDARDKVVAPGFIDIHTHYDAQVLWDRGLSVSPWHGVTTAVLGNCGFGLAPTRPRHRERLLRTLEKVEGMSIDALRAGLGTDWSFETFPEYLDLIEQRGTAINVGVMLGHTPLRLYVMGEDASTRAASEDEIAQMSALVAEAMRAGAVGLATSSGQMHLDHEGNPVPSRLADAREHDALARAMGTFGRGTTQATIGAGLMLDDFERLAVASTRPLTWTALLSGMMGPGSHRFFLDETARMIERGVPVFPQVSCRPLVFELDLREPYLFDSLPTFRALAGASRDKRIEAYKGDALREELRAATASDASGPLAGCWSRTVVSSCPKEPTFEEQSVEELARAQSCDPSAFVLDLASRTELEVRLRIAVLNFDEREVAELLSDPNVVLGLSDAGAHASQLCDACFSTYLLGHWVRERSVMSLERAVHLLTGRAADLFGFTDRGRLAVGTAADVVVFDPARVGAGPLRRVHDQPGGADRLIADAIGIDAVVVNGRVLRRGDDQVPDPSGPLPGRLLRAR